MVNLVITTKCQKGCSFCFAVEQRSAPQEMSVRSFEKIILFLKKSNIAHFKLLGGEPTTHSSFIKILSIIEKHGMSYTLVTNGLITDQNTLKAILNSVRLKHCTHLLLNVAELQSTVQKKLILHMFNMLSKHCPITGSITLNHKRSVDQEVKYIVTVLREFKGLKRLRVSLDFPATSNAAEYILNNKTYGEKILKIYALCKQKKVELVSDCIVYPCNFDIAERQWQKLAINIAQFSAKCIKIPLDIMPDSSYIHCYSAGNFGGKSIFAFKTFGELSRDINIRKVMILSKQKRNKRCLSCKWLKVKYCLGLCLGCYKSTEQPLLMSKILK